MINNKVMDELINLVLSTRHWLRDPKQDMNQTARQSYGKYLLQCIDILGEHGCDFSQNEALATACDYQDLDAIVALIQCCRKYYSRGVLSPLPQLNHYSSSYNSNNSNRSNNFYNEHKYESKQNNHNNNNVIGDVEQKDGQIQIKSGKEMLELMLNRDDQAVITGLIQSYEINFKIVKLLLECPELIMSQKIIDWFIGTTLTTQFDFIQKQQIARMVEMLYQILLNPNSQFLQRLGSVDNNNNDNNNSNNNGNSDSNNTKNKKTNNDTLIKFMNYFSTMYKTLYDLIQQNPSWFRQHSKLAKRKTTVTARQRINSGTGEKYHFPNLVTIDYIIRIIAKYINIKPNHIQTSDEFGDNDVVVTNDGPQFGKKIKRNRLTDHFGKVYDIDICNGSILNGVNNNKNYFMSVSQDSKMNIYEYSISFDLNKTVKCHRILALTLDQSWTMGCGFSLFCSDKNYNIIYSCGLDNVVTIYKMDNELKKKTAKIELEKHVGYVSQAKFINENEIVSVSGDGSCILWDIEKGECRNIFNFASDDLTDIAYCDVGNNDILFAIGCADNNVYLFCYSNFAECVGWFKAGTDDINSVQFSPNGTKLVVGSDDGYVRIYQIDYRSILRNVNSNPDAKRDSKPKMAKKNQVLRNHRDNIVGIEDVDMFDFSKYILNNNWGELFDIETPMNELEAIEKEFQRIDKMDKSIKLPLMFKSLNIVGLNGNSAGITSAIFATENLIFWTDDTFNYIHYAYNHSKPMFGTKSSYNKRNNIHGNYNNNHNNINSGSGSSSSSSDSETIPTRVYSWQQGELQYPHDSRIVRLRMDYTNKLLLSASWDFTTALHDISDIIKHFDGDHHD